jgi:hypothetical protein
VEVSAEPTNGGDVPRYVIERALGDITDEELWRAAERSKQVREDGFPEIDWEHSHVVRTSGGLTSFCIYTAPDVQVIRDHAAAVGIPADQIHEIHADIVPQELP